eukprot:GHVN01023605.1.p1 GENE.GHVN01023605.1~~GHVN01023605.1.p1  ORF type:complete len:230 (+),score=49.85 GHVN01023605.1:101-790(+)
MEGTASAAPNEPHDADRDRDDKPLITSASQNSVDAPRHYWLNSPIPRLPPLVMLVVFTFIVGCQSGAWYNSNAVISLWRKVGFLRDEVEREMAEERLELKAAAQMEKQKGGSDRQLSEDVGNTTSLDAIGITSNVEPDLSEPPIPTEAMKSSAEDDEFVEHLLGASSVTDRLDSLYRRGLVFYQSSDSFASPIMGLLHDNYGPRLTSSSGSVLMLLAIYILLLGELHFF